MYFRSSPFASCSLENLRTSQVQRPSLQSPPTHHMSDDESSQTLSLQYKRAN